MLTRLETIVWIVGGIICLVVPVLTAVIQQVTPTMAHRSYLSTRVSGPIHASGGPASIGFNFAMAVWYKPPSSS